MRRKQLFAVLMAGSMAASLAACGKTDTKKTTAATEKKTEAATEKKTEAATEKKTEVATTEDKTEKATEKETEAVTKKETITLLQKGNERNLILNRNVDPITFTKLPDIGIPGLCQSAQSLYPAGIYFLGIMGIRINDYPNSQIIHQLEIIMIRIKTSTSLPSLRIDFDQ